MTKLTTRVLIISSSFFLFSVYIFAQTPTQTVKGKVIDQDSEMPIVGATIVLLGSNPIVGTTTDIVGFYAISGVKIGRKSFKISFVGYKDVYLKEILVESGREVVLNVSMIENVYELETVSIIANDDKSEAINEMATVSANQITIESTSRIAAGINDPGRTVQSIAGVTTSSDGSNELVIRGNSPRGVLWRMEGVEIPSPNHFNNEGSSGGGVSALSTQVLANSDFITGAFPAEYGNVISGVYDLKLRNGNFEKREYALQLGVLGLQVAAEGPIKKGSKASYLINYRYSTIFLLNNLIGTTISENIPSWQDVSFKIHLPTKKIGSFSLWGIAGNSLFENSAKQDSSKWKRKPDYREEVSKNSLSIIGLTHNYLFNNNKTYIRTTITGDYTGNIFKRDTLDYNYTLHPTSDFSYVYNTYSLNSFVNHKVNAKNLIRVGASSSLRSYNIKVFDLNNNHMLEEKGNTPSFQSYAQWKYRVTNNFEIISGFHASYLSLNKKYTIEPRLGLKWKVNEKNTVSLGIGMHSKTEPISEYMWKEYLSDGSIVQPNKKLDFTKAIHFVLGYNWKFKEDFRLRTEVYYQDIYSIPISISDVTGTKSSLNFRTRIYNSKLSNDGFGRNYGIELTLEKFFSNNWYALLTSSIFDSKYTMPGFEEKNTRFNSNYIFNVVAGKEYKFGANKQNTIGLNIRTTWRGGYRYIPINEEESISQDKAIYNYEGAYSRRLPDYFRFDFGLNYSLNKANKVWKVSIDVQNITNAKNVRGRYYSSTRKQVTNAYFQGLIPVINLLVEF